MNKNLLGGISEALALKYLKKKGYEIIEKNFRCKRGEIDIVAKNNGYIIIVEVRSTSSGFFRNPADSIGRAKIARLKRLADIWVYLRKQEHCYLRFDVITVSMQNRGKPDIVHLIDAF